MEMKSYLSEKKANITTRNFPDSVESIRKKWKNKRWRILFFLLQITIK
jgi:hypothetical protein